MNLICTCFTFIASVTMALLYSINGHINMELCRILGYLIGSCCHGLMYSYLFSSINCVLNIFNRLKKYRLSMKSIIIGIIFQWFLAFIIASIPLFLNKIDFKIKEHHCSPRRPFFMTLGIVTGFLLPIIFMTTFNLMIYCYINKLQANGRLGLRKESSDRRNEKNFKLLRQFAAFSFVFIFGWGFISFITIFDVNDTVPEGIYLITLSFPSLSLLIITLLIINWNQSIKRSIFTLFKGAPSVTMDLPLKIRGLRVLPDPAQTRTRTQARPGLDSKFKIIVDSGSGSKNLGIIGSGSEANGSGSKDFSFPRSRSWS